MRKVLATPVLVVVWMSCLHLIHSFGHTTRDNTSLLLPSCRRHACKVSVSTNAGDSSDSEYSIGQEKSSFPQSSTTAKYSHASRRDVLRLPLAAVAAVSAILPAQAEETKEMTVLKLPSGLKYIDLEPGTGPSPAYGQLVSIAFDAYIKLPASQKDPSPTPQLFEKQSAYLIKHGNGRTIPGLDEGLHSMKVGGKRRILIPPKLGYVESGLGPVPAYPWDRVRLNQLLEKMIALQGGTVIFEVRLLSSMDDEADQGYYQDASLSPEEFQALRDNLQQAGRVRREQAEQNIEKAS